MTLNRPRRPAICKDDKQAGKAQRRLYRAYQRLGTWRALAEELGLNPGHVYDFVMHGKMPPAAATRARLGILGYKRELPPGIAAAADFLAQRDPGFSPARSRTYTRGRRPQKEQR